jgi:hypothetical protein
VQHRDCVGVAALRFDLVVDHGTPYTASPKREPSLPAAGLSVRFEVFELHHATPAPVLGLKPLNAVRRAQRVNDSAWVHEPARRLFSYEEDPEMLYASTCTAGGPTFAATRPRAVIILR